MAYKIARFFLLSCYLICCWPDSEASNLNIVQEWVSLDFRFPSEKDRQLALSTGDYIPGASVPTDVDKQDIDGENSRIFVAIARFDKGRPITFGTVDDDGLISAYPDYSWNDRQRSNCDGLTSVYKVAIDQCNRLWVMDTGKLLDTIPVCPPQLLAFDLRTDTLIFRFRVNEASRKPNSIFATLVVDVRDDCDNTFIYVGDVLGYGLLVVDMANNRSWLISHRYFYPHPNFVEFYLNGVNFEVTDGILGMALSAYSPGQDRILYFHALASVTENTVLTSIIRNDSFIYNSNADPHAINILPGMRQNQSTLEAIDNKNIMYFGIIDPPSVWCWNTANEFSTSNFYQIAVNRETLQFALGVKIVNTLDGEQELWVVASALQKTLTGTVSSNETNYRIHAGKVSVLLQGSACGRPLKGYHSHMSNNDK